SVGKSLVTGLVAPRRSRTVLSYSKRVRRRMYDGPGSAAAPVHSAPPPVLVDGGPVRDRPPTRPVHEVVAEAQVAPSRAATRRRRSLIGHLRRQKSRRSVD